MPDLIKNIPHADVLALNSLVQYNEGQVVSRTLAQNNAVSMTLFALAAGEGISSHTTPGDAMVVIIDGEAEIAIGEKTLTVGAGQTVVMPADVPHALEAVKAFKMLLVVVKRLGAFPT